MRFMCRPRLKKSFFSLVCFGVFCIVLAKPTLVYADEIGNKAKAVFMFKLLNYITWPQDKKNGSDEAIRVCFYKQSPLVEIFQYIQQKTKASQLLVQVFSKISENIKKCHVLFLNASNPDISTVLKEIKNGGTLIISDQPNILETGGMISLTLENNTMVLDINRTEILKSGMKIDSKLLRIARMVR